MFDPIRRSTPAPRGHCRPMEPLEGRRLFSTVYETADTFDPATYEPPPTVEAEPVQFLGGLRKVVKTVAKPVVPLATSS